MIATGRKFARLLPTLCAVACLGKASAQEPAALPTISEPPASVATLLAADAKPAHRGGVSAGAGVYLMQAFFQNNPAYTVFSQQTFDTTLNPMDPNTQTLAESARRVEVKHNLVAAPIVWLGYENDDGFGARIRAWGFQEGTSQTAVLPPFDGPYRISQANGQTVIVASGNLNTISSAAPLGLQAFGDTLSIQHGPEATAFNVTTKLAMYVGDLELTQRLHGQKWTFLFSGGVRYANIDQTYNAYDAQSTGPAELRTLISAYRFQGVGPTLALEMRRPIADCGLGIYGLCRGSMVFGGAEQTAAFFGQELRNDDPNPQYASQNRNRGIPIVDFELGTEFRRPLGCTSAFGQIGVVGQQWFNAGSASRSSNMNPSTTLRPVLGGAPIDSNLALLGLTFRVGLDY